MKNAIIYYYNLIPENMRLTSKYTKFNVDNNNFVLELVQRNPDEINDIYQLSNYLLQINVPCHQIIPNVNNQIITLINNQPYILLKVVINSDQIISENDILFFSNLIIDKRNYKTLHRNNWGQLWASKIDYLEYQVSQFGKKYSIIRDSFSYHIGLAENALQLYKNISTDNLLCVAHKRIKKDCTMYDLYNPLEFIIDTRVRDFCEYCKQRFFYNNTDNNLAKSYIYNNNLTEEEIKLFFCRMLFPTVYFDLYEDIVIDGENERELIPIITEANNYENLLKELYTMIEQYIRIDIIEWLKISS